jgi:hypothetical protein
MKIALVVRIMQTKIDAGRIGSFTMYTGDAGGQVHGDGASGQVVYLKGCGDGLNGRSRE